MTDFERRQPFDCAQDSLQDAGATRTRYSIKTAIRLRA